ncbi:MAG: BirA family transcriptional regulator [Thermosipho sp. (in: thermotogales)]|nr:BirA family transcriptional regulator [Thermosipho sp. (in: thermotogales)]MDN5325134.1 BirA family transcriptional regulator [Thermosipho sp. (in: thermotogales)]
MIGDKILIFEKIDSTNEYLKKHYKELNNGTVIVAIEQTAGKGRYGRKWISSKGGLWFSILLKPKNIFSTYFFTKLASFTLVKILKRYKVYARIKWPNDIFVNGKKLAGILTEVVYEKSKPVALIIGIGINLNNQIPDELKSIAISLKDILNKNVQISGFLKLFLKRFNTYYLKYRKAPYALTRQWKKLLTFKEGDLIKFKNANYTIEKIENDYIIISNEIEKKKIFSISELEGDVKSEN